MDNFRFCAGSAEVAAFVVASLRQCGYEVPQKEDFVGPDYHFGLHNGPTKRVIALSDSDLGKWNELSFSYVMNKVIKRHPRTYRIGSNCRLTLKDGKTYFKNNLSDFRIENISMLELERFVDDWHKYGDS